MKPLLPDIQSLLALCDRGMSHQEIADWIEEHEGVKVSRGSVASAFSRAGKSKQRPRYKRHLPWHVKAEHQPHYDAKMLRVLGKRDGGGTLTPDQEKRLNPGSATWLLRGVSLPTIPTRDSSVCRAARSTASRSAARRTLCAVGVDWRTGDPMRMIPETRVFIEVEVFARGAWWPGVVEHWRELNGRREAWVRYTTGVGENRLGWFSVEAVRPVMSPMQDAHDEGALGPLFEQTQ